MGRHQSLFEYLASAVRAAGWYFQNVFCSHWIASRNVIEDHLESEFRDFRVAVLAKCNQVLRLR
jgi:hypothetical protein